MKSGQHKVSLYLMIGVSNDIVDNHQGHSPTKVNSCFAVESHKLNRQLHQTMFGDQFWKRHPQHFAVAVGNGAAHGACQESGICQMETKNDIIKNQTKRKKKCLE